MKIRSRSYTKNNFGRFATNFHRFSCSTGIRPKFNRFRQKSGQILFRSSYSPNRFIWRGPGGSVQVIGWLYPGSVRNKPASLVCAGALFRDITFALLRRNGRSRHFLPKTTTRIWVFLEKNILKNQLFTSISEGSNIQISQYPNIPIYQINAPESYIPIPNIDNKLCLGSRAGVIISLTFIALCRNLSVFYPTPAGFSVFVEIQLHSSRARTDLVRIFS